MEGQTSPCLFNGVTVIRKVSKRGTEMLPSVILSGLRQSSAGAKVALTAVDKNTIIICQIGCQKR
jgi:hypothetical protein